MDIYSPAKEKDGAKIDGDNDHIPEVILMFPTG